jgi:hypothetical protein
MTPNTSPFKFLYTTERERHAFGPAWCGPDELPNQTETVVARFPAANADGHAVVVTCQAWPARFYTLWVAKPGAPYKIETGSGMTAWAAETANAIAAGFVGIVTTETAASPQ